MSLTRTLIISRPQSGADQRPGMIDFPPGPSLFFRRVFVMLFVGGTGRMAESLGSDLWPSRLREKLRLPWDSEDA